FEEPVAEVVEESFEEPVAEVVEESFEEPVAEVVEESFEEPVAEVVEESFEEPVAEVVEEVSSVPLHTIPPPVVPAAVAQTEEDPARAQVVVPNPVGQQSDFDAFVTPAEDAAVALTDEPPAAEAPVAEEVVPDVAEDSEVVAMDMAERLRLARAELEAELHPGTVPAEDIAATAEDGTGETPEAAPLVGEEVVDNTMSGLIRRRAGQTRYVRQSAKLPRITESGEDGSENLSSMSGLRARMLRGKSKDAE
ncbi:MAG: hypothetical protein GY720_09940, partial [bacterium]|nr:hypothetical protein [bacterium]